MPSLLTGLHPDQIDDLVNNTLNRFERDKWVDLSLDLQRYFAMQNLLLDDKVGVEGGTQLQWQVKVRNTGSAKNTGMFGIDDVKVQDVTKNCKVGWTKQTCNFAYDIDEEGFQSGDAVRLLSILKVRRHDAMSDFAELMESNFWGLSYDDADDAQALKPYGVPYWIVRNATKGFNGTTPIVPSAYAGHTTVAALNPTTYTRWANYTGQYVSISKRDLVRLLREATIKCYFRAPVGYPNVAKSEKPRHVLCTTYEVVSRMEELLEEQNTNLGNDVASKDGLVTFRRSPVEWIPWLEDHHDSAGTAAASTEAYIYGKNPIYGIDRNSFRMVFKRGAFMRRTRPLIPANQHSARHVHYDTWMQYQCFDRRRNFVVTQS